MIFKSILGGVLFSLVLVSTSHLALADDRDEFERNQKKCVENFNNIGVKFYSHIICENIRMQEFSNNPNYMSCVANGIELEKKGEVLPLPIFKCKTQEVRDLFNNEEYLGCVRFFRNNKLTDADSISACKEKAVIEATQDSKFLSCISAQNGAGEMKSASIIRCTDQETRSHASLNNTQYLNCHKAMKKFGLDLNDRFAFCNKGNFEAVSDPRFYSCVKSAMGNKPQQGFMFNRDIYFAEMYNAGALTAVENCADLKERERWKMSVMPELDDTDFSTLADSLNTRLTLVPTQNAQAVRERSSEESAQVIKQVVDGVKQFLTPAQSVKQTGKSVRVK